MTAVASAPAVVSAPAVAAPAGTRAIRLPPRTLPREPLPPLPLPPRSAPALPPGHRCSSPIPAMPLWRSPSKRATSSRRLPSRLAGKPDRFLASNHRNSVANWLLTTDGYAITAGDGTNKGGRKPANPQATAERALEAMDDETRRALFAKYLGTGNVAAAAALPGAAAPRTDTSPEFDAAKTPAPSGGPAASAPAVGNARTEVGNPRTSGSNRDPLYDSIDPIRSMIKLPPGYPPGGSFLFGGCMIRIDYTDRVNMVLAIRDYASAICDYRLSVRSNTLTGVEIKAMVNAECQLCAAFRN
jgi:hypothetical protein